jgi:hypothetical protein
LAEAEGVADRLDVIADFKVVGIAKRHHLDHHADDAARRVELIGLSAAGNIGELGRTAGNPHCSWRLLWLRLDQVPGGDRTSA